ncbi:MAG: hypothetical protein RI911_108 [Candidatus Parcubacteria bacterium]|jgi:succinate dehydrogenase/fumarate reductase cytochrome b subunit
MEYLNEIVSAATQLAQAAPFKGLLGDSLMINNQSIYAYTENLGEFINAVFRMTISIAAVVAVCQFVYGGIVYMMTESGAVQMGESKERMRNALLGLIMLLATYVVFNQINPELLNLGLDLEQLSETQRGGQ